MKVNLLCVVMCMIEDMPAGGYFGEQALGGDAVSDCTVTAVDSVECFVLDRRRIEREFKTLPVCVPCSRCSALAASPSLCDERLQNLVVDGVGVSSGKVILSPSAATAEAPTKVARKSTRPVSDIEFSDLEHVAPLGSGTFGRVTLVRHKPV